MQGEQRAAKPFWPTKFSSSSAFLLEFAHFSVLPPMKLRLATTSTECCTERLFEASRSMHSTPTLLSFALQSAERRRLSNNICVLTVLVKVISSFIHSSVKTAKNIVRVNLSVNLSSCIQVRHQKLFH